MVLVNNKRLNKYLVDVAEEGPYFLKIENVVFSKELDWYFFQVPEVYVSCRLPLLVFMG